MEFKMPLPPVKKQKTLACIREIQVHKLWTKVYSQKGLTATSDNQLGCGFWTGALGLVLLEVRSGLADSCRGER